MGGFAVLHDESGRRRFQACGLDGGPLTAPLTDINFCVWAITSQFPHLDFNEAQGMSLAFQFAGLAIAMEDALALVLRNTSGLCSGLHSHNSIEFAYFSATGGTVRVET